MFGMAASVFFSGKKAHQTKGFCPRMVKNCQRQHKGRQHTQKESQGAATSVEDVIMILRGLNYVLCTVCMYVCMYVCTVCIVQYVLFFKWCITLKFSSVAKINTR